MGKVVSLEVERVRRIVRKALAMRSAKWVVGYCDGPDAAAYVQAVWETRR